MRSYELILERGTLGALRYASEIDKSDPRFASEIDNAVIELQLCQKRISKALSDNKFLKTAQEYPMSLPDANFSDLKPSSYTPSTTQPASAQPQNVYAPAEFDPESEKDPAVWTRVLETADTTYTIFLIPKMLTVLGAVGALKIITKLDLLNKIPSLAQRVPGLARVLNTIPAGQQATASRIIQGISETFPALSKFTGLLRGALGAITLVLDTAGLIAEYNEYGPNPRFWCKSAAALASAASLIPSLTLIAFPLSMAISLGCNFVGRGDDEVAKNNKKTQGTQAEVTARAATLQWSDLSHGDKGHVIRILNTTGQNREQIRSEIQSGIQTKIFDNVVDVTAALEKELATKSFVPKQGPNQ